MISKKILSCLAVFSLVAFFGCCCKKQEKTIQKSPEKTSRQMKDKSLKPMATQDGEAENYAFQDCEDFDSADFAFLDDLSDEELVELDDSLLDDADFLAWDDEFSCEDDLCVAQSMDEHQADFDIVSAKNQDVASSAHDESMVA